MVPHSQPGGGCQATGTASIHRVEPWPVGQMLGNVIHCIPMALQDRESMGNEPVQVPRESPEPRQTRTGQRPLLEVARVLALIGGLSAAAIGVLLAGLFTAGSLLQGQEAVVSAVTIGLSMVVVTVGLGLAVAWQAVRSIQGHPSRPFRPPRAWPLALLFLLAVAGGQIVLSLDLLPAATFPPFHLLAATLPPLTVLALVGRALPRATRWRELVLQLGAGALVATPLAFALEAVLIVGLALMATFSVALRPGGPELLERLAQLWQTAPPVEDLDVLLPMLRSPAIIAGVTAVAAGAVPLIEEAVKAIGVPLLAHRRPSRPQALLWGLAGGAGFALVEGLLSSVGGLQAWALVVVVRLGATLLHCLTGALMGLAWYQALRRRWLPAFGLYAGSVTLHSVWNLLSVGVALLSLDTTVPALAGLSLVLMAALAGTALALALGLAWLTYSARSDRPIASAATARPSSALVGSSQPVLIPDTLLAGPKQPSPRDSEPRYSPKHRTVPGEGGENR